MITLVFIFIVLIGLNFYNSVFLKPENCLKNNTINTSNQSENLILTEENFNKVKEELEWFSGFAEAKSMFFISNTGYLNFRIKLHYDDRDTLIYIKNLLSRIANRDIGVIVDSKDKHESYFSVDKFMDIYGVIIPIFTIYFLTTTKYWDFLDFKTAAEIKFNSLNEKRKLSSEELKEILKLKSGMNSLRKDSNISNLLTRNLTPYRLLGFMEGDGTFCISNLMPVFSIKQHSKNIHFLHVIAEFLNKLPYNPSIGPKKDELNTKPVAGVYKSDDSSTLVVSNILQLYNYILPFFKNLEFKSRKGVDFKYWEVAVKLRSLGYTTLPQGKKLLVEINNYINKRYTTTINVAEAPKDINKIFELPPVYDLSLGLSYKAYSDLTKVNKGGFVGYGVNVYENGKLIKGSPFSSYTKAALALGSVNISSVISKKIDTGKMYKNKYTFESYYPDITN